MCKCKPFLTSDVLVLFFFKYFPAPFTTEVMEERELSSSHRICAACKSRKAPMFSFPKDLAVREAWRLFFGLEFVTDSMRICSSHFQAEDIRKGTFF